MNQPKKESDKGANNPPKHRRQPPDGGKGGSVVSKQQSQESPEKWGGTDSFKFSPPKDYVPKEQNFETLPRRTSQEQQDSLEIDEEFKH